MEKLDTILKIASIISNNDDDVLAEITDNISNIKLHAKEHLEDFEARNAPLKYTSYEDFNWAVAINILIRNNYIIQCPFQTNIIDFGWEIRSLRTFKEYGLFLDGKFVEDDIELSTYDYDEDDEYDTYDDETNYSDEDGIVEWCKTLDNKWFDEDICIGMIDISENVFTLFLACEEDLETLEDLADNIGKIISSVY